MRPDCTDAGTELPVLATAVTQLSPSNERSILYPVNGNPPVSAGATHVRTIWPLPAVALGFVGADAGEEGSAETMFEVAPLPALVTALTRNNAVTPLSKPTAV